MRKTAKQALHIVSYGLMAIAAWGISFALTGCTHEIDEPFDDDAGTDSGSPVQIGFRIRLTDNDGADSSGLWTDGIGCENYIGIENQDFCFMLFDGNGRFVEKMAVIDFFPMSDAANPADYTVLCALKHKPAATFKVVALANWGTGNYPGANRVTPGTTTIADLCDGSMSETAYRYAEPFIPSTETPIPMYGVKTCTMPASADKRIDIGDLYLLRAMAKIEVCCRENSGLKLASVRLIGHNTGGYRTPRGMYDNTGYVSSPHIPANVAIADTPLEFTISGNKAVLYIPEYRNTGLTADGADISPCRLAITFADNSDKQYTIDFCRYENGQPTDARLDILRNVCYSFTIDKTPEFSVDLIPYGEIELDPVFGI